MHHRDSLQNRHKGKLYIHTCIHIRTHTHTHTHTHILLHTKTNKQMQKKEQKLSSMLVLVVEAKSGLQSRLLLYFKLLL